MILRENKENYYLFMDNFCFEYSKEKISMRLIDDVEELFNLQLNTKKIPKKRMETLAERENQRFIQVFKFALKSSTEAQKKLYEWLAEIEVENMKLQIEPIINDKTDLDNILKEVPEFKQFYPKYNFDFDNVKYYELPEYDGTHKLEMYRCVIMENKYLVEFTWSDGGHFQIHFSESEHDCNEIMNDKEAKLITDEEFKSVIGYKFSFYTYFNSICRLKGFEKYKPIILS